MAPKDNTNAAVLQTDHSGVLGEHFDADRQYRTMSRDGDATELLRPIAEMQTVLTKIADQLGTKVVRGEGLATCLNDPDDKSVARRRYRITRERREQAKQNRRAVLGLSGGKKST